LSKQRLPIMSTYSSTQQTGNNANSEALFQKHSQTIATSIQKILQNVSTMNRMVNQIGTVQETNDLRPQLHQIRTYTQQLVKDTDGILKDLVNNNNDRHLKIQRERLVDEFTTALTSFQAVQRKTVEVEKKAVQAARASNIKIPKPPGSYNSQNSNQSIFENNFVDNKGPTQIQMQDDANLLALEEQERTIRELEENIVGVNEIYKKLGALVYEQGLVVDSIESSVEQTSVFVTEGTDQLRKASQYQTKLRKKKLFIAIIIVIVLAILITLICWQTK